MSVKSACLSLPRFYGAVQIKKTARPGDIRLQRRLQEIEAREPAEKRLLLQALDVWVERGKLEKKTVSGKK